MQINTDDLRKHYSSLSDDALLAIKPTDLTEVARNCYDAELNNRKLTTKPRAKAKEPAEISEDSDVSLDDDKPDWLSEAAIVFSRFDQPGAWRPAEDVTEILDVLTAAKIPCYLDVQAIPEEDRPEAATRDWQVKVPGNLNLRAASVLERDIFNDEFEAEWKAHLEVLPDAELRTMTPQFVFCGLFDRVERVNKVYEEEVERRSNQAEPA